MTHQAQNATEETYVHVTKWNKPIWKGYTLYDSNSMTFHYRGSEKISGSQRLLGRERWIDGVRGFLGLVENILHDSVVLETCHYTFVKIDKMCNTG
jgi:hypothetical protein